jgi:hydroxylysine kinase
MVPSPSLGASLLSLPPSFPPEVAAKAAAEHFGLRGRLTLLTSERDVNYRLDAPEGRYVLKLTNPAEPPEVTDLQTAALVHLEAACLPIPRVIASRSGAREVHLPQGVLRLLTYLEGTLMHLVPPSRTLRSAMGEMAARLSLGLQAFHHSAADHVLQWDIRHAARLRPLLVGLPEDIRPACTAILDHFDSEIAPVLPGLRWQVVHNDLNPHNILVSPDHQAIAGILDFGDMVRTPLICDLAVAASYQIDHQAPQASLLDFITAYHHTLPLTRIEAEMASALVQTRWLTTLCIATHRAALYPENASYILRNVAGARAGLLAFAGLDRAPATRALHTALRPL